MDLGIALERFGALYTRLGQHESSVRYYRRALDTFRDWEAAGEGTANMRTSPSVAVSPCYRV